MAKKFIRQEATRHSKIGKNRKKLQKWRKPKGRDSKMRLNRKSYPATVKVGYKNSKKEAGKIMGLTPVLVHNLTELNKLDKKSIVIVARVGAKKKLDIIRRAEENKIKILNLAGQK